MKARRFCRSTLFKFSYIQLSLTVPNKTNCSDDKLQADIAYFDREDCFTNCLDGGSGGRTEEDDLDSSTSCKSTLPREE